MIIWQGAGPLALFFFAIPILASLGAKKVFGAGPWDDAIFGVGNLLAAIACWKVGRRLNHQQGRELVDPKTGERVVLRPSHSLMFVKFEYWSALFVLVALLNFFK